MSGVSFSVDRAADVMAGQVLRRGATRFHGVSIDSRKVAEGQAFFAIAGDRFDGHAFVRAAAEAGAALLVVHRQPHGDLPGDAAVVMVDDTRIALADLARAWRLTVNPKVLAITGSVGKTTTKELCRSVLLRCGPTHATPGNFNNDIGLPLTLLSMPADTAYLVAEMGMNAPGEISTLTRIAAPDVGLITRIAPAHLEGLGSIEAVAAAKAELIDEMPDHAVAVLPGDEPLLSPWTGRLAAHRLRTFGADPGVTVRLLRRQGEGANGSRLALETEGGRLEVLLPLPGAHNALNAAAAAAATRALGADLERIVDGLSAPPELGHRSRLTRVGTWRLLDDCYNANPTSMNAALDTVVELSRDDPKVALLGKMAELGPTEEALHRQVGAHAAVLGLDLLLTVGPLGRCIAEGAAKAGAPAHTVVAVDTPRQAARKLQQRAPNRAWILVKASRAARLERVVEILQQKDKDRAEAEKPG